jgi:hypothetical protein
LGATRRGECLFGWLLLAANVQTSATCKPLIGETLAKPVAPASARETLGLLRKPILGRAVDSESQTNTAEAESGERRTESDIRLNPKGAVVKAGGFPARRRFCGRSFL